MKRTLLKMSDDGQIVEGEPKDVTIKEIEIVEEELPLMSPPPDAPTEE